MVLFESAKMVKRLNIIKAEYNKAIFIITK